MARPSTPELDILETQYAELLGIDGGDDWHTSLAASIYLTHVGEQDPALHVSLAEVSIDPDGQGGGTVGVTWQAFVPLSGGDQFLALRVLADMRKALVPDCSARCTTETGSSVTLRGPGSDYSVVTITTSTWVDFTNC